MGILKARTWATIRARFSIHLGLTSSPILEQRAVIWSYAETDILLKGHFERCVNRCIGKVNIAKGRKVESCHLRYLQRQVLGASLVLHSVHPRPLLVEQDAIDMLLDDVFCTNRIGWVITPRQDVWKWDGGL